MKSNDRAMQFVRVLGALVAVIRDRYGHDVAAELFANAIKREANELDSEARQPQTPKGG